MSTNKTPNYQLHSWLGTDDFRFHEVNENFAKLDAALADLDGRKPEVIIGTYVGDGTHNRHIGLGFRPDIIHLEVKNGIRYSSNYVYGGLATPTSGINNFVVIDDTGFSLMTNSTDSHINDKNLTYLYLIYLL